MISEKRFTTNEFHKIVPDFAQKLIDEINKSEGNMSNSLSLSRDGLNSYLVIIDKPGRGKEMYSVYLENSHVNTISVYGV